MEQGKEQTIQEQDIQEQVDQEQKVQYQKLVAGDMTIDIITALGAPADHNGVIVDSLRVVLPNDITQEQIDTLMIHPWKMYTHDGHFLRAYTGYNHVAEHSITVYKLPDEFKLLEGITKAADEITAALAQAEEKKLAAEAAEMKAKLSDQQLQAAAEEINTLRLQQAQKEREMQVAVNGQMEMRNSLEFTNKQMQTVMNALDFAGIDINTLIHARAQVQQAAKNTPS